MGSITQAKPLQVNYKEHNLKKKEILVKRKIS